jgi:protein-S-isoprenylcysteine O-methyltransferase Ste14
VTKIIIFGVISGFLVSVSWASFRRPRSHGFYRFFAWEAILGLVLRNIEAWFADPFSLRQIASWTLLTFSAGLVVHGAYLLRRFGRRSERRADETLLGLEKTTSLVTVGAFRYIRHPLYSSLLFLAWGTYFKLPEIATSVLVLMASAFLVLTARADEAECIDFFGAEYEKYMRRTKRFIPFIV